MVFFKGQKYLEFQENSPSDIALSCWECEDLIDAVNDDRLSPSALMKFKNLYRAHSYQLLVVPVLTFPVAFVVNKWLQGNYESDLGFMSRGMASSRFNFAGMFLIYPLFLYYGYTRPINRKYYTELLADNGDDGEYIRDCVSYHKPGLWKQISSQLNGLGLDFKQNLITRNGLEFPTNFVSSRTIF